MLLQRGGHAVTELQGCMENHVVHNKSNSSLLHRNVAPPSPIRVNTKSHPKECKYNVFMQQFS